MKQRAFLIVLLCVTLAACESTPVADRDEAKAVVAKLNGAGAARTRAVERLEMSDPYLTWRYLVRLFEPDADSTPEARIAAIELFSKEKDPELTLPGVVLEALRTDSDMDVRRAALDVLVRDASPEYARSLQAAADATDDEAWRQEIEEGLRLLERREREYYRNETANARLAKDRALAARRLGLIGTEADVAFLIEEFRRQSDATIVKQDILMALAAIGGPEASEFCRSQLLASDPFVRGIAVHLQIELRDETTVDILGRILGDDKSGDIRESAARALTAIGNQKAFEALAVGCKTQKSARMELACGRELAKAPRAPR